MLTKADARLRAWLLGVLPAESAAVDAANAQAPRPSLMRVEACGCSVKLFPSWRERAFVAAHPSQRPSLLLRLGD